MSVQQSWPPEAATEAPARSNVRDLGNDLMEICAIDGPAIRIDVSSLLFDPEWYRARYLEPTDRRDPTEHYMQIGWRSGFDPNPFFSTREYVAANPDVAAARLNPFIHYVLYGAGQGRRPRADA